MIPNTILIAALFTILFLLIKLLYEINEDKKKSLVILCGLFIFISALFWGISLFGSLWYEQVASYIMAILCTIILTPKWVFKVKDSEILIGKEGVVTGVFNDKYEGNLNNGDPIINLFSKDALNVGDGFKIIETTDKIWVEKI